MDLDLIKERLSVVEGRTEEQHQLLIDDLKRLKQAAVSAANEDEARLLWCLEETLATHHHYLEAFSLIKAGRFYDGWCELEQSELSLGRLARHVSFGTEYLLEFIAAHVPRFQALYPYRLFASPEVVATEKVCSICGQRIAIRKSCGHRAGEVYGGEYCVRIVKQMKLLSVSMVTNPAHKYAVMFPKRKASEPDPYDYTLLRYVSGALASPFHGWTCKWTEQRQPHSRFSDVGRNQLCPCGSPQKYKRCCLPTPGVLRPHCQVSFDVPPADRSILKPQYVEGALPPNRETPLEYSANILRYEKAQS